MTAARGGISRRRAAARRRRGYSLVEVAIVLVASGLLAGGPILLLHNKVLADNYESVSRQLRMVKGRVVEYASTRRTAERLLAEATDANNVRYETAAGRPYLPCPDTDGDGVEDREEEMRAADAPFYQAGARVLDAYDCVSAVGFVPHETLGVKPTDPWGNRLIYAVDAVMSNPLVGFDGKTRPSSYDERSPASYDAVDGRLEYPLRSDNGVPLPPLICVGHPGSLDDDNCTTGELQGNVVGGTSVTVTVDVSDQRNRVEQVFVSADASTLETGEVIEGLAFALISPGRYRQGGIYLDPAGCMANPHGTLQVLADIYNYQHVHDWLCGTAPTQPLLYAVRDANVFGEGKLTRSDDLGEWMTASELAAELGELGVFPVKEFPLVVADDDSVADDRADSAYGLQPGLVTLDTAAGATDVAVYTELMPLALADRYAVTLPPGDYTVSATGLTQRVGATPFSFSCDADPSVPVQCAVSPAGGLADSVMTLSVESPSNLDVTIEFGLFALQLVTDPLPVSSNTDLVPWR